MVITYETSNTVQSIVMLSNTQLTNLFNVMTDHMNHFGFHMHYDNNLRNVLYCSVDSDVSAKGHM